MTQRILKIACFSTVVLFSNLSFSADEFSDELSLDDQFATEAPKPAPTDTTNDQLKNTNAMDEFTTSPEPSTDLRASQDLNLQTSDQSENVNLASPVELRQRENALFGFSAGLMLSAQPYHESYDVGSTSGGFITRNDRTSRETEAIQNLGVIARYAEAPLYGLGADINISYSRSQNHSSITVKQDDNSPVGRTLSEVANLKGEVNLTYAIEVGIVPVYFLAGLGAEKTTGAVIETIINPMGYGGQVGAGFVINSTINLEGVYSYYRHHLSDNITNDLKSGPAPKLVNTDTAQVVVQGLVMRGTYSFNF